MIGKSPEPKHANASKKLGEFATGRDNNFNLIRFVAASLVVASHSMVLSQGEASFSYLKYWTGMDLGNIAVDTFFVTSGFLVTGSILKRTLFEFARARILRIYPAYVCAILFCIFVVGALSTSLSLRDYFFDPRTSWFGFKNLCLIGGSAFSLPGVFQSVPIANVVNGSLWTLPWEGRMYAALFMLAFLCTKFTKRSEIIESLLVAIGPMLLILHLTNKFVPFVSRDGLRVSAMFFVGAFYYVLRNRIPMNSRMLGAFVVLVLGVTWNHSLFFISYNLLVPYIILGIAYLPRGSIHSFNRLGDYSYGLYIYSFPIQQVLVDQFRGMQPSLVFAMSYAITLLLSILSWHLVEKRFLSRKTNVSVASSVANEN